MPDLSHLEPTLVGVAGEYFVAAELSLRGCLASVTLRNSRGIDIIASSADASKSVSIQVKTTKSKAPRRIGKITHRSGWLVKYRGVRFEPVPWVGDGSEAAISLPPWGVLKSLESTDVRRKRGEPARARRRRQGTACAAVFPSGEPDRCIGSLGPRGCRSRYPRFRPTRDAGAALRAPLQIQHPGSS